MSDFFGIHGSNIIIIVLAILAFGKLLQRQRDDRGEIKKLQDQETMTPGLCKDRQSSCHLVQRAYQGSLEKDIVELRADFKSLKTCNEAQHTTIMRRGDKQHDIVVGHLIAIKRGDS